jgi:hypothetical protein
MRTHLLIVAFAAAALTAAPAGAQAIDAAPLGAGAPTPGWTFTPSLGVSQQWDDNVLVQGKGDHPSSDLISVLNPNGSLGYFSKRTSFSAGYNGAFELYRQFDTLNNYGQFQTLSVERKMTSRTSLSLQQQFSSTPTTELPSLVGVPFVRIGARVADVRGGIDHVFTKRTSVSGSYDLQWIAFDKDPVLGRVLIGGHGHTGTATLHHQLTAKMSLIADGDIQHATVIDGSTFTVESVRAGASRKFDENFSVFAEAGVAHVSANAFEPAQTSPSWRAGAARQFERFVVDASYSRAFVPAFGVGDTLESEDIGAHARGVITRRWYTDISADWRRDHPLSGAHSTLGEAPLRSLWFTALAGYTASPWLRVEAFYTGEHQTVNRPGGRLNRDRVGIQLTTTKPMRVR